MKRFLKKGTVVKVLYRCSIQEVRGKIGYLIHDVEWDSDGGFGTSAKIRFPDLHEYRGLWHKSFRPRYNWKKL